MTSAGDIIGAYRLVRSLGQGGMGEVWLAAHEQIGSQVAIKLVRSDTRDPDAGARFLREAKATARVRHPNIVAVSDYGERAGGGAYLVMELLDGETLAERMRRARLALEVVLDIAVQIADALAAAHDAGIVHRDLKPNNIFLVDDRAARAGVRVKLLDFGIAKDRVTGELAMTATGQLVGTPLYMAPEQCASRLGPVEHRSDLYALGVVLYELVTGAPPFRGPSVGDLVDQHVNETPVPPRARLPSLPARLEALILSLLAKRPADRPAGAAEVARTLRDVIGGSREHAVVSPLSATLPSTLPPAAPVSIATKPRRLLWLALAGVAIVGVLAVVFGLSRARRSVDLSQLDAAALERECRARSGAACFMLAETEHHGARPALSRVFARYQTACDLGVRDACARLAWMYTWGAGVRSDYARARSLADRMCTAGSPGACDVAGDLASSGLGGGLDVAAATRYFRRGCDLGGPDACSSLGRVLYYGMGGERDERSGRQVLERAFSLGAKHCESGQGAACRVAGLAYARGTVVEQDHGRAATLIARACELGVPEACADAGQLYAMGIGVAKDPVVAERLLQLGCDRGYAPSCAILGIAIANGMAGPIDHPRALSLAREACERGDRNCTILGNFYAMGWGVAPDVKVALVHYERACAAGDPEACAQAASMNVPGTERDPVHGEQLLQRSCTLGGSFACKKLGDLQRTRNDHAAARASYTRACAISDEEVGCDALAAIYLDGLGVPVDAARGRAILEKGCNANVMLSCHALGLRLRDGKGVTAHAAQALSTFEQACRLGWGRSCISAAEILGDATFGLSLDPNRANTLRARACELEPKLCDHSSRSRSESAPQ